MLPATDVALQISDNQLRKVEIVTWPAFPKRLQSALKALCCLAQAEREMQSQEIAKQIDVPIAETSKILQFLVWGGFVTSRRGSKGGFHLASSPERVTMGEVINFFLARHPVESEKSSPVMLALSDCMAPCQKEFSKMSLAAVTRHGGSKSPQEESLIGSLNGSAGNPLVIKKRSTSHRRLHVPGPI